jgi:hypothetical protein
MWDWGAIRLGYHDHYVVDGGKRRIILAILVTPADVMENVPLRDLLWRVCFRRKLRPRQVTGDTTYGTAENIVALEDAGIRAFFPLPDFAARTPFFGKGTFRYEADQDVYRCPQGQRLRRRKTKHTEDKIVYRADTTTCNACPIKVQCTASDHGLPEGDAQTPGLGRAALRRSEGVAWLTPAALTRPHERQYPGATDCGRAEPQALPGRNRVGPASCPVWQPPGPAKGAAMAPSPLRAMTHSSGDQSADELDLV